MVGTGRWVAALGGQTSAEPAGARRPRRRAKFGHAVMLHDRAGGRLSASHTGQVRPRRRAQGGCASGSCSSTPVGAGRPRLVAVFSRAGTRCARRQRATFRRARWALGVRAGGLFLPRRRALCGPPADAGWPRRRAKFAHASWRWSYAQAGCVRPRRQAQIQALFGGAERRCAAAPAGNAWPHRCTLDTAPGAVFSHAGKRCSSVPSSAAPAGAEQPPEGAAAACRKNVAASCLAAGCDWTSKDWAGVCRLNSLRRQLANRFYTFYTVTK